MKKQKWLYWVVAVLLVCAAGYSFIHVRSAEKTNSVKVAKEMSSASVRDAKISSLKKDQRARQRKPIDWNRSSLTGAYPDLTKYLHHLKGKKQLWIEVSLKKQRVYIMQGQYRLYTMYASVGKNYENTQEFQRTPIGTFKIQKQHGTNYFDATKNMGAKYWTSFHGHGAYRFESVPFNQDGHVINKQAKRLGKKVTKKNNIKNYGSIRLAVADARWLQENIPAKTRVVIHNRKSEKNDLEFLY
ncbi:L,D-transpeptidase [Ligilactobacillus pabuli]|uniref:L,D-transpeptidase n=1 Tax=Ligilactobacillus pabuli TaxID=2886039 RepID=A0ABQ5JK73_9LACO|nr:L,D-transpeptidase [Ligilactobacillus pabuli]GKS81300.1 L,D-transpeptidase [Ligilactobacillus pabuli]